jgi:hypothetical protein
VSESPKRDVRQRSNTRGGRCNSESGDERNGSAERPLKDAREELMQIIDAWALAHRVRDFLQDASTHLELLPDEQRLGLTQKLHHAKELVGGIDVIHRLCSWRSPADREPSLLNSETDDE